MRLYLDDDSISRALVAYLRRLGHDVQLPADIGLAGAADAVHMLHAIQENRIALTHNYDDYRDLHHLVIGSGGSHPGVLAVRRDRDRKRNMRLPQIAGALERIIVRIPNYWFVHCAQSLAIERY